MTIMLAYFVTTLDLLKVAALRSLLEVLVNQVNPFWGSFVQAIVTAGRTGFGSMVQWDQNLPQTEFFYDSSQWLDIHM